MTEFFLKYRDTLPILVVTLLNPDNTVHDLSGVTNVYLNVRLESGGVVVRTMDIDAVPSTGIVRYSWEENDWLPGALEPGEHLMEYEAVTGTGRLTFPNGTHHRLLIKHDIGQGV